MTGYFTYRYGNKNQHTDTDMFVSKRDAAGNVVWGDGFGSYDCGDRDFISPDFGYGVAVDASGDLYITGFNAGCDGVIAASDGLAGNFVAKLDADDGSLIWVRHFGPQSTSYLGVAVDGSGNAYVTGPNGYVAKYDTSGNSVWVASTTVVATAIAVDMSGDVYVDRSDGSLQKFDSSGNSLWVLPMTVPAAGIAVDASGDVYATGDAEGMLPGSSETGDVFLAKYDGSGDRLWVNQFGTTAGDDGAGVAVDTSGNVYVTGSTSGTLPGSPEPQAGSGDAFVAEYDASGNAVWVHELGSTANDAGGAIAVDASGDAYISGETAGTPPGSLGTNPTPGSGVVFVAKLEPSTFLSSDVGVSVVRSPVVSGVGDSVSFTSSVANVGPDPAANVVLTQAIPAGGSVVTAAGSQGTCSVGTSSLSCALGNVAAASSATVSVTMSFGSPGLASSGVVVSTDSTDPNPANNTATSDVNVLPADNDVATVAGNGTAGFTGDAGLATAAELSGARGVAVDSAGDVFVADTKNNRIREVNTSGQIMTVAGGGSSTANGVPATAEQLSKPAKIALDAAGDLFIADTGNQRVLKVDAQSRLVSTIAGVVGHAGYNGDAQPATSAWLSNPADVAIDGAGDVFVADTNNNRIRRIDHASGMISSVAGGTAQTALLTPNGVTADSAGDVWIADAGDNRIVEVTAGSAFVVVAGTGTPGFSGDGGPATSAALNGPAEVAIDGAGDVFISDVNNARIRRIDTSGVISTVAGTGSTTYNGDGPATASNLDPRALAISGTGLWVADALNNRIRILDIASDVAVSQTASADPVDAGQPLSFHVTIANNGPVSVAGVTLTDTPPAVFASVSASQGSCSGTAPVVCAIGTLATGASASITINSTPRGGGTATNIATTNSIAMDPYGTNNASTRTVVVNASSADLAITSTSPATAKADASVVNKLIVHNNGPGDAPAVTVTDSFGFSVQPVTVTTSQGTCTSGRPVTCTLGTIPVGGSVTVKVTLRPIAPGTVPVTASVASALTDPNPANDNASVSLTVKAAAKTKYVSVADGSMTPKTLTVAPGTTVQWNFLGNEPHDVTDSSGLGLYQSGSQAPGSDYRFTFTGAGKYTYTSAEDSPGFGGTINVAPTISPASGTTTTTFTLDWATTPPSAGFVYDIQIQRPTGGYTNFLTGSTSESKPYTPDDGAGNYTFRVRLRDTNNNTTSQYATTKPITVS